MAMGGNQHLLSENDMRMKFRVEDSNGKKKDNEKRAMGSSFPGGQQGPSRCGNTEHEANEGMPP